MLDNLNDTSFLSNDKECPEIYVACLSSYNHGILYGAWINAAQPVEDILEQINQLLAKSPMEGAEEFAFHDYQGFYSLSIGEYESIAGVHEKAMFVVQYGELGAELAVYYGGNLEQATEALEEYYQGEYQNRLDYAAYLFDELYLNKIPENLRGYIDYQSFKRDIFMDNYFALEVKGSCHVFSRH
jgi:antirestriction protein